MIKAIVFDYGGVIETIEGGLMLKIANYLKIDLEDWLKVYSSLNYLCNTGKKSYEEVYALTAKKLDASDVQISHIHEMMRKNRATRGMNFELLKIIKNLKSKNYKIGLLSNNYTQLRQELIDQNIIDLFDVVIISSEVGYQKPQPEIFEYLFKGLNLKADEIVFVDDTKQSLTGAEKIGYTPILFMNNKKLKEELEKLGVLLI